MISNHFWYPGACIFHPNTWYLMLTCFGCASQAADTNRTVFAARARSQPHTDLIEPTLQRLKPPQHQHALWAVFLAQIHTLCWHGSTPSGTPGLAFRWTIYLTLHCSNGFHESSMHSCLTGVHFCPTFPASTNATAKLRVAQTAERRVIPCCLPRDVALRLQSWSLLHGYANYHFLLFYYHFPTRGYTCHR